MFSTAVKPSLSLFCRKYFKGRRVPVMAITNARGSPIRIYHSRQATLHTAPGTIRFRAFAQASPGRFLHRNTGSSLIRTGSASGASPHSETVPHKNRSPRKQGRVPHAIEERPENASTASVARRASPQHPPQTGRSKQAQGVSTICPSKDF